MSLAVGIDLGTFHTCAVGHDADWFVPPSDSLPSLAVNRPRGTGTEVLVGDDAQTGWLPGTQAVVAPKLALGRPGSALGFTDGQVEEALRKLTEAAKKRLQDDLGKARLAGRVSDAGRVVLTVPPSWEIARRHQLLRVAGERTEFLHEPIALYLGLWAREQRLGVTGKLAKLASATRALVVDWGAGTVDVACLTVERNPMGAWIFHSLPDKARTYEDLAGGKLVAEAVRDALPGADEMTCYRVQQALARKGGAQPLEEVLAGRLGSSAVAARFLGSFAAGEKAAAAEIGRRVRGLGLPWLGQRDVEAVAVIYGGPLESENLRRHLHAQLAQADLGFDDARVVHASAEFCASRQMRRDQAVAVGAAFYGRAGQALPQFDYRMRHVGTDDIWPLRMDGTKKVGFAPRMRPPIDVGIEIQQGYGAGPAASFEAKDTYRFSLPVRDARGNVSATFDRVLNGLELHLQEVDRQSNAIPRGGTERLTLPEVSTRFRVDFGNHR